MNTASSSPTVLLCPWCERPTDAHDRVPVFEGEVGAIVCDQAPRGVLAYPIRVYRFTGTPEAQPWGEPYAGRPDGTR